MRSLRIHWSIPPFPSIDFNLCGEIFLRGGRQCSGGEFLRQTLFLMLILIHSSVNRWQATLAKSPVLTASVSSAVGLFSMIMMYSLTTRLDTHNGRFFSEAVMYSRNRPSTAEDGKSMIWPGPGAWPSTVEVPLDSDPVMPRLNGLANATRQRSSDLPRRRGSAFYSAMSC